MPDEEVKPLDLDQMADASEEEVKAALERLKQQQTPPPPPEEALDPTGTEPAPKPAETKVETKVEEPPAPKPEEQKPERDGTAWKLLRQRERELADLRKEIDERQKTQPVVPAKEPTYEEDPAEYLKRRTEQTENELTRLRAEQIERDRIDRIRNDEAAFAKEHPDYFKATEYLIDHDMKEWEKSGLSVVHTRRVLSKAGEWVDQISQQPNVREMAEKQGRDPRDMAAYLIARQEYQKFRQHEIDEGAAAQGISVAQNAYDLAQGRGYTPVAAAEQAKNDADKAAEAARARVLQAKEIHTASESLSDASTTEGGPSPKVIRNRNQIVNMPDDELDALIEASKNGGGYRQL